MNSAELFGGGLSRQTALALIDVEARLMPDAAVNAVAHAVFDHFNRFGRIFTRKELGTDFKSFAPARSRIRTVINAAGPRGLHEKSPQKRTISFNAG